VALCLASRALAAPPQAAAPATSPVLTLQACRQIALEQQPSIAAAQASLKAAVDRADALENLHVPKLLARDLPIRRKQSALGVAIARGGVMQTESETLYGVTYSYLAALYAAQQVKMADEKIRRRLEDLKALVTDPDTKKARRDVILEEHAHLVNSYLATLDGRIQEAKQGKKRAMAALREAMGVGTDCSFVLPDRDLPCPRVSPKLEQLLELAQTRRGELTQAFTVAEVVGLEVEAQGTSCRPSMKTFASGSDLHARPIPAGGNGGLDYKPAALAPEMPALLAGSRSARMEQARDYHRRAEAVAAKTRNLIALDVENLYRRWAETSAKANNLDKAYRESLIFSEKLKTSFNKRMPGYPNVDEIIAAGIVTTRLQLEWRDAHYRSLLALAALERATAGGFCVDFDAAPPCEPEVLELPGEAKKRP
jgi:outer membrane protein TolC